MHDHVNEDQLETFLLQPETLSVEETGQIHTHVQACSLCREHLLKLEQMYKSVEEELKSAPTQRDRDFAERLLDRGRMMLPERGLVRRAQESLSEALDNYAEVIEPYRRAAVQRFVRWARIHPVRFATASAFSLAALAMLTLTVRTPKDTYPTLAAVKNAVLSVYDKEGRVLWTRSAVGIPDIRSDDQWDRKKRGQRILSVDDIDGDGTNEIILAGYMEDRDFSPDTIYCFEGNGRLRWQAGGGEMISFGKQGVTQHSTAVVVDWIELRKNTQKRKQFFVLARDYAFSPSKLFELDPKTGKELHAYYNRGHAEYLLRRDVNKDGNIDLVLGGVNDSFNSAFIAVFDPDSLSGHAPVVPSHLPTSTGFGTEKYYILFPRTEVGDAISTSPYNNVSHIETRYSGGLIAYIQDVVSPGDSIHGFTLVYTLEADMKCSQVVAGDGARPTAEELFNSGRIKHRFTPDEINALKDSLLYWDGDKFVKKPTMNTRYRAAKPLP